ncbi:MAG: hypothetical protein IIX04_02460, partial [Alistipes sp.]|nr:hypothetical protein [Alistipes sp.]
EHIIEGKLIEDFLYVNPTNNEIIRSQNNIPFYKKQHRVALRNCGFIDPEYIQEYIANKGFLALAKVLSEKPQPKPTPLKEETKVEPKQKAEVEPQNPRLTPTHRRPMTQQKRGADRFVVLAVIVLVLALAAIGYGYYVSQLAPDADDAQMDALRVEIERPSNN